MVARAIKNLREKYQLPLTAEGMIADIPMSRRRLHDAFLRTIGRSVADELTRLRIGHAKRRLAESDTKLSMLSQECGFSSQARLVIVFSKSTGMTPGEYRHAFNPAFSKSPKPGRPRSPKT
jgi:transcriptional regulator GlxA family with amidase domain